MDYSLCFALLKALKGDFHSVLEITGNKGHPLAQLVVQASHVQRLCPHSSSLGFRSRPGALCCTSPPPPPPPPLPPLSPPPPPQHPPILFPVISEAVLSIKLYKGQKRNLKWLETSDYPEGNVEHYNAFIHVECNMAKMHNSSFKGRFFFFSLSDKPPSSYQLLA